MSSLESIYGFVSYKCKSFIYACVLDVEAVLSTVADEVIGFVQWLFRQITGAVAALWNH